ncbi:MAG: holo-ACP synthase [Desulfobacterota bacterium]|nr:holo-ACP synthase [Thermodesulfobacteriota bacterium]
MIIGTGLDIVNIERIERVLLRWGDRFLERVYTGREIDRCQRRAHSAECFATRFAAKEAFLKALGSGLRHGIHWREIEVENDPSGRPFLLLHGKAKEILHACRVERTHLTLSHDRPFAVAQVLLEGRER